MPKRQTLSQEAILANRTFSAAIKEAKASRKGNKASSAAKVTTQVEER